MDCVGHFKMISDVLLLVVMPHVKCQKDFSILTKLMQY